MNIFANQNEASVKEQRVNTIPPTGVYLAKITQAYILPTSKQNTISVRVVFEFEGIGYELTQNYYDVLIDGKSEVAGKPHRSYEKLVRLCRNVGMTLEEVGSLAVKRVIGVIDQKTRKEEPTQVLALAALEKKLVQLAGTRKVFNGQAKTEDGWIDTNEKRREWIIMHTFNERGQNATEAATGAPSVQKEMWANENTEDWVTYRKLEDQPAPTKWAKPTPTQKGTEIKFD